jgi:predicted nucleic acid-binding protein
MSQRFVCNASPLIAFERLDKLSLLQQLTGTLYIPAAVRREVFGSRSLLTWIVERPIEQPLSPLMLKPRLGAGEREAIALALEMSPCHLLVDDLDARRTAEALDIPVIGTLGLLLLARQQQLITALKPYLDTLLAADFRIAAHLYQHVLRQTSEIDKS